MIKAAGDKQVRIKYFLCGISFLHLAMAVTQIASCYIPLG